MRCRRRIMKKSVPATVAVDGVPRMISEPGFQTIVNGHTDFLHDAWARNFEEAIISHGGDAQASRNDCLAVNRGGRVALIRFLESI